MASMSEVRRAKSCKGVYVMMDALAYYSIGFSALWAVAVLPRFYGLFRRHVVPHFHSPIAKIRYHRIQGFTRLGLFNGFTPLELLLLLLYIGGNGAAVAIQATRGATIASSTVLASTINLVPLLLGGRTNRVADVIGVSRPSYYVAHHWIGRVAVLEALVHSAFGLVPSTQGHALDRVAISGCIVSRTFRHGILWADTSHPGVRQLPRHPRPLPAVHEA